jgi:hypothetical protein
LRPQNLKLLLGELKHEISRKPLDISPDLLVQSLRRDTIERGNDTWMGTGSAVENLAREKEGVETPLMLVVFLDNSRPKRSV